MPTDSVVASDPPHKSDQHVAEDDQLRTIIDTIPTLAWSARADGSIEFCNKRWLDYTGLVAEQVLGWGWSVVIHPDDQSGLVAYWQSLLRSGEAGECQARMRSAAGGYRWFLIRGSPLRDRSGRIVRWYGTNTDIEELKRAQDILRASEQDLRLIIDSIPGLVYTMTADGEVELFNRPLLAYVGRMLEELKGWPNIDVIHPDDRPGAVAAWQRSVESGEKYEIDERLRGTDGSYRWFHLRAISVRDTFGHIVRWYGLLTDIDDQRRAHRRLRRAIKARYEAALAERNRIARDMHDGVLQDITGIALQLEALLPHAHPFATIAVEQVKPILESVRVANRAARQAVLGIRARPESADLVAAVHGEAQRLTAPALTLSMHLSGPARLVSAAVRDVAVSFTHEAMTNVVRHANAREVSVSVVFTSKRLRVSVRDDGSGFTAQRDMHSGASHFGLVGMRERATSIGAALRVTSAPGSGTTVRLDVPLRVG